MWSERLVPSMDLLCEEYVLVQAWKKTAAYIRYHNWYADTLALDRVATNLPSFINELQQRLKFPDQWENTPLRIVPAPKGTAWHIVNSDWVPEDRESIKGKLRPLAHLSIADQVIATGLAMCMADRVETIQGDPLQPIKDPNSRKLVISYGNRLFCDVVETELSHRWGSAKLYRSYFQDYRSFVSRPTSVVKSISSDVERRHYVVHADIKQFYDHVSPNMLSNALAEIRYESDDPQFFELLNSLFNWKWDAIDGSLVDSLVRDDHWDHHSEVALPQGLVASGFFANVALLKFDETLKSAIGTHISPDIWLVDACRYVDDLRILVGIESDSTSIVNTIENVVSEWIGRQLSEHAPGLDLNEDKTQLTSLNGDSGFQVAQSERMNRIQGRVSGGFDARGGEEILDALRGLVQTQSALRQNDELSWKLKPIPDVRDETVARFSAGRYRTTFRSLRPMLLESDSIDKSQLPGLPEVRTRKRLYATLTRRELDEDMKAFALGLVNRWVEDPSNVRLLRIGLDLWPDDGVLQEVINLLRPLIEDPERLEEERRIGWYCLAEIFRAGAIETGFVTDKESLPSGIDLLDYGRVLLAEAIHVISRHDLTVPWYVRQQALLLVATLDPSVEEIDLSDDLASDAHYVQMIRFLRGDSSHFASSDFATFAALARRCFVGKSQAIELTSRGLSKPRAKELAQIDPSFLIELRNNERAVDVIKKLPVRLLGDLCLVSKRYKGDRFTLADLVLNSHPKGLLRNELSVLRFAQAFLAQWQKQAHIPELITPQQVSMCLVYDDGIGDLRDLKISKYGRYKAKSLYEIPSWTSDEDRWRPQLGFLIRFILAGHADFTLPVRKQDFSSSEDSYRSFASHWFLRKYGFFNGQQAFGDDWLPITKWLETFLLALLRWPGCRLPREFKWVSLSIDDARLEIQKRIDYLETYRGNSTRELILPLPIGRPDGKKRSRSLRACVVQTMVPSFDDFTDTDLSLSGSAIRQKHRSHLAAVLATVERTMTARETHKKSSGLLDWLILPELSVHPEDVKTHLIPFARAHRTIVFAGLTYEELFENEPLVNTALWIIPEWSDAYGLQVITRRQGKFNLAPNELKRNENDVTRLQGFRACQWLIGYPWSSTKRLRPVWLSGAVCYDATDLGLASDLRTKSDIFAIPAFNRDINTFDQMALALHYHMFQLVVVANTGLYGGSNAYWPHRKNHIRRIFHTHGQPQTSISFFEIEDISNYLLRQRLGRVRDRNWKYPPAGF